MLLLFVIGGVLPGRLFASIPVTQVFRRYTEGKKGWKRPLLFIQFAGVTFIAGLMMMVTAQYQYVMNKDMGFSMERIAGADVGFPSPELGDNVYNYLRGLPYVEDLSSAMGNPLYGYSGTFIMGDDGKPLFSARFDATPEHYAAFMGMTMLQGRPARAQGEVVVNETFARRMKWGNDVVGQMVNASGDNVKVVGLLKDFQIMGFYSEPMPYIAYWTNRFNYGLHVKLKEPFGDNLLRLQKDVAGAFPTQTIDFRSMQSLQEQMYNPVRVMRNATIVSTFVMLVVMLMGLLGYTADEVQRRSKEIAIRKVNGAQASGILELLARDILYVATPAVVIGVASAWYVNGLWSGLFSEVVPVGWPMYILLTLLMLAVIVGCVLWCSWRIANENPVISLRSE